MREITDMHIKFENLIQILLVAQVADLVEGSSNEAWWL